ncbi:MAG: polysaccharide biosynthesis/export family protein [Candidatus Solibacter usitatus]|nr:polysaccharide biosynthesis/export family protein [Candidatus Solibacter usitatus]
MRNRLMEIIAALLAVKAIALGEAPSAPQLRATYVLGPNDQITIRTSDIEDIERTVRIPQSGFISFPQVGRVPAGGLTIEQLENELTERLKVVVRHPQVSVDINEFRSQPVSVVGAVKNPGVHQLEGRKTLIEMLALAGGLREDAGYRVKITREMEWGVIPIPGAAPDPAGKFSIAEIDLKVITEAKSPTENVLIKPRDVISVSRAAMVYVIGEVKKSGGFVMTERQNISVLQVLSLAEGMSPNAAPQHARILRSPDENSPRSEIALDLKRVLAGKDEDVALRADDILFIPNSYVRRVARWRWRCKPVPDY